MDQTIFSALDEQAVLNSPELVLNGDSSEIAQSNPSDSHQLESTQKAVSISNEGSQSSEDPDALAMRTCRHVGS